MCLGVFVLCLNVCVVIIEAHLLSWDGTDVSVCEAAVWFDAGRCVLFYQSKVLLWKRGVIVLLKPEPSSDLFVDLLRTTQKNEQICRLPSFSHLFFHLLCTRGRVC